MKTQKVLSIIILILFIATLLPLCTYLQYDTGERNYVNYYRSIGAIAVFSFPISGLFTLIAFFFALGVDRWRLLTSGIWILVAGLWPLVALLVRYRSVIPDLLPPVWCIIGMQILVGLVSIFLAANKKRWNQDGKPVK